MFSIVIPVYGNEDTIPCLIQRLEEVSCAFADGMEVVFVVDGSPDRSFELLSQQLPRASFSSQLLLLSKNFGSFAGIRRGLEVAQGPYFAVIAADLQDPPELVLQFHEVLSNGEADIVLGERTGRKDPWTTRVTSHLFWWFYRRFVQHEMLAGGVDVFACNQPVRDALLRMEETNSSLVGQLIWLGFRRKSIPYIRERRVAGKSTWTFRKKWAYMLNSIFSFTSLPIALLGLVGCAGVVASCVLAVIVFFCWCMGRIEVSGYTPLMLVLLFSSSAHLIGLSVVGSYVWRTYENSKRRPQSIVLHQLSFPISSPEGGTVETVHPLKRDL